MSQRKVHAQTHNLRKSEMTVFLEKELMIGVGVGGTCQLLSNGQCILTLPVLYRDDFFFPHTHHLAIRNEINRTSVTHTSSKLIHMKRSLSRPLLDEDPSTRRLIQPFIILKTTFIIHLLGLLLHFIPSFRRLSLLDVDTSLVVALLTQHALFLLTARLSVQWHLEKRCNDPIGT